MPMFSWCRATGLALGAELVGDVEEQHLAAAAGEAVEFVGEVRVLGTAPVALAQVADEVEHALMVGIGRLHRDHLTPATGLTCSFDGARSLSFDSRVCSDCWLSRPSSLIFTSLSRSDSKTRCRYCFELALSASLAISSTFCLPTSKEFVSLPVSSFQRSFMLRVSSRTTTCIDVALAGGADVADERATRKPARATRRQQQRAGSSVR